MLIAPFKNSWWKDPSFWIFAATIIYVASAALYFAKLYHFNVVDDVYIAFQYVKNLSSGQGLVFNPGERVEGYTNFLWILLLTPLFKASQGIGFDFVAAAIVLNIVIALFNLILLRAIGRILFDRNPWAACVPLLFCAADNAYVYYAMSAMENHLFILFSLVSLWVVLRPSRFQWLWLGLSFSLLQLTRPDGFLFVFAYLLAYGFRFWRTMWKTVGVWLLVYGSYFLGRALYYKSLLPNTYYVKAGCTPDSIRRGLDYTVSFLSERYYLPAASLGALAWIAQPIVLWLALFIFLHAVYIVAIGGDFYSGHRFYVVLLPLTYLLIGKLFHELTRGEKRLRLAAGATIVSVALIFLGVRGYERGPYNQEITRWGQTVDDMVRYMTWLGRVAPPGASMVVADIGTAGFLANLKVIDVFGIVDSRVARKKAAAFGRGKPGHEKIATTQYLLETNPTYIKCDRGCSYDTYDPDGYYIFNDFPPDLNPEGFLWAREDLTGGFFLPETAIHFDKASLTSWKSSGDAFSTFPTTQSVPHQQRVFGQEGPYLNTYTAAEGDRATGTLTSPPIPLLGDRMILRVGGGRDADRLQVSLIVNGRKLYSTTGQNSELLGRRVWDISALKGQTANLEITDMSSGPWGHILVDEVIQWEESRKTN